MWPRIINAALGVWLMAAPAILDYGRPAATADRIISPLIISFAVVAIWETTRQLRRMNTLLGIGLFIVPLLLGYATLPLINSLVVGVIVIGLSLVQGKMETQFGGGWSVLWSSSNQQKGS
jgi:hypothetical protein